MTVAARPIPLTVIGGYLGAGKTTLVNQLLRQAGGRRLAVLVNDFGELPIDAALIEASSERVLSIAGGCVCCSYGNELMETLLTLPEQLPGIEQVLVETSGVALPGAVVAAVSLLPAYRLEAVLVLADAASVRQRAADRYLGDTITRQLADADLVLLNKTDLLDAAELPALQAWLAGQAPHARVLPVRQAAVPIEWVLGGEIERAPELAGRPRPVHTSNPHHARSVALPQPVDAARLARGLADPVLGLVRAKGLLAGADGRLQLLQMVGARWQIDPAPSSASGPGRLVVIGLGAAPDADRLDALLQACSLAPEESHP